MPDTTIRDEIQCGARVCPECFHGRTVAEAAESDLGWGGATYRWRDDGTYDRRSDTIVCDPCYVTLMPYSPSRALFAREIPEAIAAYREAHPTIPGTT